MGVHLPHGFLFLHPEFDSTLADLKQIGRVEQVSEAGEDSAVWLATAARHQAAAETHLSRPQKLQREHESLLSTVAQAHISAARLEDYRAPLQANFNAGVLQLRNPFIEGIGSIFSSALCLGVSF
jgi:hypothetical protein